MSLTRVLANACFTPLKFKGTVTTVLLKRLVNKLVVFTTKVVKTGRQGDTVRAIGVDFNREKDLLFTILGILRLMK